VVQRAVKKNRIKRVFAKEAPRIRDAIVDRTIAGKAPRLGERSLADVDAGDVAGDVFVDDRPLQPTRSAADAERSAGAAAKADAEGGDGPDVRIAADALIDRSAHERMGHPDLLVGMVRQVFPVVHVVITTVFLIHFRSLSSRIIKSATSARLTFGNPLSRTCSKTR